jgi:hypothetical protein
MGDPLPVATDTSTAAAAREAAARAGPPFVVLEKLEGWGDVFDGPVLLGVADYSLKDVQETTNAAPLRGDASVMAERQRNMFGVVRPREAGLLAEYVGRRLTLRLADGRRLPFTVSKVLGPHRFLVQGLNLAD